VRVTRATGAIADHRTADGGYRVANAFRFTIAPR
jgi:hypothetical protein